MKKFYLIILLVNFSLLSWSQEDLLKQYLQDNKEAYIQVKLESFKDIPRINKLISVEIIDDEYIGLYISKANLEKFNSLSLDYEILTNPSKLFVPKMYNGSKDAYEWDSYPTYDTYIAMMEQFAADYPDICEVFSIGTSNEGRELKFVKISDNVNENEPEPQFLYTGTIHGDETTGFIMLLRLIDYLTSNYGTDAEVTEMVDNLEIWINPASNPDGTYAGGNNTVFGATRYNANGVDMNRNYADPQDGPHPDGYPYQVETEAFMDMADNNNFVISANTHGGAEVVNYPWDTWYSLHPDDDWWQFVSHEFADTAQANSPSSYMNGFDDGITNGAAWYSISGGRQDYMNYFHYCREVTLEISDTKLLPESQLVAHWDYLHRSLINYIKQALYGLRGYVTDSQTGDPLSARVEIAGHDFQNSHVFSAEDFGDYYRYLKSGSYDITFSKEGYLPQTIENVQIVDYETTILNVELESAALIADFSVDQTDLTIGDQAHFTQQCYGDPDSFEWYFEGGSPETSTDENPVVTYNQTGSFTVSLTVTKGTDTQTMTKEAYIHVDEHFSIENGEITTCSGLFLDSGGLDSNYGNNEDFVFTIYGDGSANDVRLLVDFQEFDIEYQSTCNYDYLKIFNGVGTSSELIGTYCGTDSPGIVEATNAENALTFQFHSDGSQVGAGWKAVIDCTILDNIAEISDGNLKIYPNPANNVIHISLNQMIEEVEIINLSGQIVYQSSFTTNELDLNIDSLLKGIYIVKVRGFNQNYFQKLEIK